MKVNIPYMDGMGNNTHTQQKKKAKRLPQLQTTSC